MIDVARLILELRPDLAKRFPLNQQGSDSYLSWLMTSGILEYAALRESNEVFVDLQAGGFGPNGRLTKLQFLIWRARTDVQQAFPLPHKTLEYLTWFFTHGLEEHGYWRFLSPTERGRVLQHPEPWQSRIQVALSKTVRAADPRIPFEVRPFGVNLIGYAFGELGIGEDVRMAGRALLANEIPMVMLNFQPGSDIPQNDRSMEDYVSEQGSFAFNIFCMTALENGRYFAERGRSQFVDRYNIGYWPWELGRWPARWDSMIDLVDEVWVSSLHTFEALAPVCTKPLLVMPMAVELGEFKRFRSRRQMRAHFDLPATAYLFCFSFDLNSSIHRKNPQACVSAFLQAFPNRTFPRDQVGLVIKTHRPSKRSADWEKLKTLAAKDSRIHIIEGTLSRPSLLALYKACDCFVSLHRAEGFGRGIAEALQLGLRVIATDYSGNVDFCHEPHADLVRYNLIKVKKGQYPYGEGQVWANADIHHAAELMRKQVVGRSKKPPRSEWLEFSAATVGARYRKRLDAIYRERLERVKGNAASKPR